MNNFTSVLEELAEIRTRSSIIGLAVARIIKRNPSITECDGFDTYLNMIDESILSIQKHVLVIEKLTKV